MSTATLIDPMQLPDEQRMVLFDVDWAAYEQMADALTGRHVRLTYDRGTLEFMTISPLHGRLARLLYQFVVVLTQEYGLPRRSFGDMTCRRSDLLRGLEADECFYITREPDVRGKDDLDFSVDPPPDLAIEIDLSRPSGSRLSIYEALGVPEVWRYHQDRLIAYTLNEEGRYDETASSVLFPLLPVSTLTTFLDRRNELSEDGLMDEVRTWVRNSIHNRSSD